MPGPCVFKQQLGYTACSVYLRVPESVALHLGAAGSLPGPCGCKRQLRDAAHLPAMRPDSMAAVLTHLPPLGCR